MNCEDVRASAAVALLMRTPLDAEVTEHLAGCAECRAELARLGPLPGLLATLDHTDLEASEPAGSDLLDRLLFAAAVDRKSRRARVLAVAAVIVALLVVPLGVLGVRQLVDQPVAQPVATAVIVRHAADASTGISGRAEVWKAAWGSDLAVSISGVPSGTRCTVVVVTKDGHQETAATWKATYAGTAEVNGTVAAAWKTIMRIDIVDDSGKVLLRM